MSTNSSYLIDSVCYKKTIGSTFTHISFLFTNLINCLFTGLKHVKKFKKEPESDIPRLCHVCGEQAGKHSYYGGQVCPSCRAFFRRSVQSK